MESPYAASSDELPYAASSNEGLEDSGEAPYELPGTRTNNGEIGPVPFGRSSSSPKVNTVISTTIFEPPGGFTLPNTRAKREAFRKVESAMKAAPLTGGDAPLDITMARIAARTRRVEARDRMESSYYQPQQQASRLVEIPIESKSDIGDVLIGAGIIILLGAAGYFLYTQISKITEAHVLSTAPPASLPA
jgi:hypothetical protein